MARETGKKASGQEKDASRWDDARFDTKLARAGEDPYPETEFSLRVPIYATKSYTYPTLTEMLQHHYYYARTENPTLSALDQKLALLHGGEAALSVASGMAAVHLACSSVLQQRLERVKPEKMKRLMPQASPGDVPNIVMHTNQYTGIYRLFTRIYPQMGIDVRPVDLRDLDAVRQAVDARTRILFIESPANPTVDVIDIQACADVVHAAGGKCIVDNTWASPALQRPLEHGADLVVESLTKYINGHGDCLGGAIIGPAGTMQDIRYFWLETQGAVMSPFSAWLVLRGMRTLGMRMDRHSANAMAIARHLEKHPKVTRVVYPGLESHPGHAIAKRQMKAFGGMISFELASEAACLAFMDSMKLIKVGVSLGDTTSLMEYTAYMTGIDLAPWERKNMRISATHLRFSVGLEDPADIIDDLNQALEKT